MRENRPSGSEGGAILIQSSLPLSSILSLRDKGAFRRQPILSLNSRLQRFA